MKKYKLKEYIDSLNKNNQIKEIYNCDDILNKEIEYMTYNSRDVEYNSIFICKGDSFKINYLKDAIKNGAIVYVSDKKYDIEEYKKQVKDYSYTEKNNEIIRSVNELLEIDSK